MNKNVLYFFGIYMILGYSIFAQKAQKKQALDYLNLKGEVIFDVKLKNLFDIYSVSDGLSIVHHEGSTGVLKLMANQAQFDQFLKKNIEFTIKEEDNIIGERVMTSDLSVKAATFPLTAYPTYDDYVSMMNDFAVNNPGICKLENIGTTTQGDKSLLFVKLSDNVNLNEQEPRVMYSSSMHGDELAGYPMMLNLIDFLLSTYNDTSHPRHAEIKDLLDNNEVWINPSANPDGTYRNSTNNTSVANATRGNANNVDLNRNYPDPDDGANPDGNSYQVETQRFMELAASKHFVLSANFHGGIELINYAWDTYAGAHPDKDYFLHVSEEYRDFCQENSPNGYFDARNNGITNGYDWYEVQGGRQDYQIYYHQGRELTVELSNAKTPPSSQLVNFWNYNKEALIAFLKQVNYGIRGVVTDAITNQAVDAKITVVGKDSFETWTPTELPEGDYYRPIKAGTYTLVYEAECYETKTVTGITIADFQTVIRDVQLTPVGGVAPAGLLASDVQSTIAKISWDGTEGTDFDIRYRKTGTSNWTAISVTSPSINLTGLDTETSYQVQVRSKCSSGATSPYSDSITFVTTETPACAGINNFPYAESFESGLGDWSNANNDTLDWTRDNGGTPSNGTGPSSAQDGSFYMYTEASGNGSGYPGKEALLNSPCIDLTTLSNASMAFSYHMRGSNMGSLSILVSLDDGGTYDTVWSVNGNQGNSWREALVDLSDYAGSVVRIQFRGVTGNGFRSDIAIDDLSIFSTTPDIEAPSIPNDLSVAGVSETSVSLIWSPSTDNIGVSGYDVYQDMIVVSTVTSNSATITGLSPSTQYVFEVVAKDAAGNISEISDLVTVITSDVSVTYCNSNGNNVSDEYIDYVGLGGTGGIDNVSSATNGYEDYTYLSAILPYGPNTIELSLNYTGTVYTEYWNVWIDYNKNGIFEASELMVSESTRSEAVQAYDFQVPDSAKEGETRMRVTLKYNATATPCESFRYGEVEDYTVFIGGPARARSMITAQNNINEIVRLYPNPVTEGLLHIKGISNQTSAIIYNYMGQKVMSVDSNNGIIDVSSLSSGLYILKAKNKTSEQVKRFVVK